MQRSDQIIINLQRRFATGEDDHGVRVCAVTENPLGDLIGSHRFGVREIGVAERAAEVTPGKPHEDSRTAGVKTFALQGIEDLGDMIYGAAHVRPLYC